MTEAARILVVEDDLVTRQSLSLVFQGAGYSVEQARSGDQAIALLGDPDERGRFDVVLSDIALGDTDGIAVLRAARAGPAPPAVILVTGYSTVQTAVEALRAGAYDYLLKPCEIDQLLATVARAVQHRAAERERELALQTIGVGLRRLRALDAAAATALERPELAPPARAGRFITLGPLQLDVFKRSASFDGHPLHLTPTEYALLLSLGEAPGRVQTYSELAAKVYGHGTDPRHARILLKGHVHNLRSKLRPELIQAARGVGYMLSPPGDG